MELVHHNGQKVKELR